MVGGWRAVAVWLWGVVLALGVRAFGAGGYVVRVVCCVAVRCVVLRVRGLCVCAWVCVFRLCVLFVCSCARACVTWVCMCARRGVGPVAGSGPGAGRRGGAGRGRAVTKFDLFKGKNKVFGKDRAVWLRPWVAPKKEGVFEARAGGTVRKIRISLKKKRLLLWRGSRGRSPLAKNHVFSRKNQGFSIGNAVSA